MDWQRDLPTWPLSHLSRQVRCAPHHWHVQEAGQGETVLLLHGAGSTTHTWRDLIEWLATTHHVVAIDLPGQGFTRSGATHRLGLDGMTEDIAKLCASQGWRPVALIGHSAGAAIALNLAERIQDGGGTPPRVIGINAALGHFEGVASWLFPLFAKVLALNPLTSLAFTLGGPHGARARRLIDSTGSSLPEEGIAHYARLLGDRPHVEGTLQMMARWNISPLLERLSAIQSRCLLLTGTNDKAVAPKVSAAACEALPNSELKAISGAGHLAHEEDPEAVKAILSEALRPCPDAPARAERT